MIEILEKPPVEVLLQPEPQPAPADLEPAAPADLEPAAPVRRKKGRGRPRKHGKTAVKKQAAPEPAAQPEQEQEQEPIPDIDQPEDYYKIILRFIDVKLFNLPATFQDEQDAYLLKTAFEQYMNNDAPEPVKRFFANNNYLVLLGMLFYKRFEAAK